MLSASPQNVPFVLINPSVTLNHLSIKQLRLIYTLRKRFWDDGQPISVFVLPDDSATHNAFCKKLLNVFPRQLESVWYRRVFTGTGQAPITVKNEQDMLERIANTPGAIGYVETFNPDKNNSDKKNNEKNTKILHID